MAHQKKTGHCSVCGRARPKPKRTGRPAEYCERIDCKQLGSLAKKLGKKIVPA